MNRESTEHLSSLMDGEVSQETGRFLVRRLGADGSLRQTWARYHLIRDCMRHQEGQFARSDLSSRVRHALSGESLAVAGSRANKSWFKPVAGAAIAASVALIAILTVSQGTQPVSRSPEADVTQTPVAKSFTSPNLSGLTPVSQPVNLSGRPSLRNRRMNAYLLQHYQATEEAGGGRGFVSFVPIVFTQVPSNAGSGSGYEEEDKGTTSDPR